MIVFARICHCKRLKPAKSNIHTRYFFSVHFNIILRSTPIFPHTAFLWGLRNISSRTDHLGSFQKLGPFASSARNGEEGSRTVGPVVSSSQYFVCISHFSHVCFHTQRVSPSLRSSQHKYSNLQDKCSNYSSGGMFQYPEINIQIPFNSRLSKVFIRCAMSSSDTASRCEMAINSALILKNDWSGLCNG